MDLSHTSRIVLFVIISIIFIRLSWKPLKNKQCHGFYRFFAFEGILLLLMLNITVWFDDPFSPLHIVSWLLLFSSIAMVLQGLYMLIIRGGKGNREDEIENFSFENTAHLVEVGIYRFVRHPMYASLLLLTWGIVFKQSTILSVTLGAATSAALLATARIEEAENIAYFGSQYRDYMVRSKMFIPFVL